MSFGVCPEWQPYVDAVLATEKRPQPEAPIVAGPERETGLEPATCTLARCRSTN